MCSENCPLAYWCTAAVMLRLEPCTLSMMNSKLYIVSILVHGYVFLVSNLRHGTIHLYGNTSTILWRDNRKNHCWTIRWQFSFSGLFTCNVVLTVHYIQWALALRRVFWEKQLWMQKVSACQAFKIYPDCLTVAEMGSFSNREFWRQQQEKRHFKINTCAIVTILRLSHLVRILQCWRRTLQLD